MLMRKFLKPEVQSILKQITGFDLERIFKFRPLDRVRPPKYMFLTDEDFKLVSTAQVQPFRPVPPALEQRLIASLA